MALIDRFTRAVGADLHALLDRVEDPRTLLRQALRELTTELDRSRIALAALGERIARREAAIARLDDELAALDRSLDLCLAESREDLAREVVRDKLRARARRAAEAAARDEDRRERERLSARVAERRRELATLEERAAPFEEERETATIVEPRPADDREIRDSDVEVALLAEIAARRST